MSLTTWLLGLLNRAPVRADAPPPSTPPPLAASPRCNAAGRALIQSFEQCRLRAYQDSGGAWTIGWGHAGAYPIDSVLGGSSVKAGDGIVQALADSMFEDDLFKAEKQVIFAFYQWPKLTSNEFSALVSFQFNTGSMPAKCPTLMRMLNAGDYAAVPTALRQWNHVNDQVVDGLTRRREAEVKLWQS